MSKKKDKQKKNFRILGTQNLIIFVIRSLGTT